MLDCKLADTLIIQNHKLEEDTGQIQKKDIRDWLESLFIAHILAQILLMLKVWLVNLCVTLVRIIWNQ